MRAPTLLYPPTGSKLEMSSMLYTAKIGSYCSFGTHNSNFFQYR